jgi:hypothetical protein
LTLPCQGAAGDRLQRLLDSGFDSPQAQIAVTHDDASPKRDRITGKLYRRNVHVELLPLTPVLTSMELVVKRNILASDKADSQRVAGADRADPGAGASSGARDL